MELASDHTGHKEIFSEAFCAFEVPFLCFPVQLLVASWMHLIGLGVTLHHTPARLRLKSYKPYISQKVTFVTIE